MSAVYAREALIRVAGLLDGHVDSPRSEAELIVEQLSGVSRYEAHTKVVFGIGELKRIDEVVRLRKARYPLQYLLGSQGFRRLILQTRPGVFIPRPETETMVGHALSKIARLESPTVLDVGTGTGAIGLSIALEHPGARVWATENSPAAIALARRNVARYTVAGPASGQVQVLEGDMFDPLPQGLRAEFDLVVSNPPYLSEDEFNHLPDEIRLHEPREALVAGPSGLEAQARIAEEALAWLRPGGWLVTETSSSQYVRLMHLLGSYRDASMHLDLTESPRTVVARRR